MNDETRRYGFVGVIVPHGKGHGQAIQRILEEYAPCIIGRLGLPKVDGGSINIITLIVHATPAELSGMTGRLGRLQGVSIKSGLAPLNSDVPEQEPDV